jgi:hypothetical protein
MPLHLEKPRLVQQRERFWQGRLQGGVQQEDVRWARPIDEQQASPRF